MRKALINSWDGTMRMEAKTEIMTDTLSQFDSILHSCRELFLKKMKDYGAAWRVLRVTSLTDQIYIKAQRIRSIEMKGMSRVQEGIDNEFSGIINYGIIALIQLELGVSDEVKMNHEEIMKHFDHHAAKAKELLENKNHDYGEAWRGMRTSSMTDLILMKLLRIKQIEENKGETIVSEGVDANYYDIINYSVFALIKLNDK